LNASPNRRDDSRHMGGSFENLKIENRVGAMVVEALTPPRASLVFRYFCRILGPIVNDLRFASDRRFCGVKVLTLCNFMQLHAINIDGILSPVCLPFHHTGNSHVQRRTSHSPYEYKKVLDGRKQPIRGLWERSAMGSLLRGSRPRMRTT
jgi:hypothetical protein